jgi:hypothetical protein
MTVPGLALDWRDGEFDECPSDFRERLEIACNHIEFGPLRAEGAGQIPFRKVTLAEFAEWVLSRGWCLPKHFPRNPGRTATPGDKSAGDEAATAIDEERPTEIDPAAAKAKRQSVGNLAPAAVALRERQAGGDDTAAAAAVLFHYPEIKNAELALAVPSRRTRTATQKSQAERGRLLRGRVKKRHPNFPINYSSR